MTTPSRWQLERYLPLLRLLARRIDLDRRLRVRFDWSDLVSETLLRAHAKIDQCEADTEGELVAWLKVILANTLKDRVRKAHALQCDVNLEQSLYAVVDE